MTQLASQMSEKFSKEKLIELATAANQEGRRIFAHLTNLLEWSRLQMDGGRAAPETVVLAPLIDEVFRALALPAARKEILLSNRALGGTAFSDPTMIRTVLHNLVANALKFTQAGGAVSVSAENKGGLVQITVSDTGVGIPDTALARLFSVGEKTSTPGTDGEAGTGLGLPICKEIVERNGGRIWAVSVVGEGSRFHFTLPVSGSARLAA